LLRVANVVPTLQILVGHSGYDQSTLEAALLSCDETKQAARVETLTHLAEAFENLADPLTITFSCEFLPDTWHGNPPEIRYNVEDRTGRQLGTSWVSDLMEKSNNSVQAAADSYSAGLDNPLVVAKMSEREGPGASAETAR
jgi:hypothetical protein